MCLAVLLLVGAGVGYLNVSIISWTQARTEPHLLGRTMSFLMLGSVVAAPLSLALAGLLVDVSATAMFVLAGGLVVAVCVAGMAGGLDEAHDLVGPAPRERPDLVPCAHDDCRPRSHSPAMTPPTACSSTSHWRC